MRERERERERNTRASREIEGTYGVGGIWVATTSRKAKLSIVTATKPLQGDDISGL